MFPGQNGCFCCPDPPDPPPTCVDCEVCLGVGPDGCVGVVCQDFVLEVENFANSPTTEQDAGVCGGTGTGTQCGAYNGTFPLTRYDDDETPCSTPPWDVLAPRVLPGNITYTCCEWRSDTFTATVPTFTEINGKKCVVCENVEVYYRMQFLSFSHTFPYFNAARYVQISICTAIDDMWVALTKPDINPDGVYKDAPSCNAEEFADLPNGERLFYFLNWHNFGGQKGDRYAEVESCKFEGPHANNLPICGPPNDFLYFSDALADLPCLGWTSTLAGAEVVQYPFWNCCKDSDWNGCATMQDWAENGITDVCGRDVKEWLPVRLTCAD